MVDSGDHVSPKTGLTPTVLIRKEGGSYATPAGAVSEKGNGEYEVAGNATDTNTLGGITLYATASGADPVWNGYQVLAIDVNDANAAGLAALPSVAPGNAGGLPVLSGSGTLTLNYKVAEVLGDVGGNLLGAVDGTVGGVAGNVTGSVNSVTASVQVGSVSAGAITAAGFAAGALDAVWSTAARTLTSGGLAAITAWTVNLTGNLSGSVGSVTGNVGGSVGSVTGNVGGNVVGSVGSVAGAVGSVTSAVTVGTINTDAISAAAVSSAAVSKIQSGLALAATALSTVQWTNARALKLDHLDADVSSVSGGGGTGLSGPSPVTLTFVDPDSNPVPLVAVTVHGQGTIRAGTDGVATFGLEADTYTISAALPGSGLLFPDTTLTVTTSGAATITGTAVVIPVPSDPSQTTGYLDTRDAHGALLGNVTVTFALLGAPGSDSFPRDIFTATSDADTGRLTVLLQKGAQYRAFRGTTTTTPEPSWVRFTVPADAGDTFHIPQILGKAQ